MVRHPVYSFSSGELSPLIDSRSDIDKYRSGCRTLENMIPRIYGPAERRPGTKYIDTCNGVSRVMPFIYSNTIAYILLLEDLRMWFYFDGGRVLDAMGRRLGIDTPYLAADLFEIQYKQSNDVMWLVHGSYAPRKLTRTSATAFSLDAITFTNGPFLTRNDVENADGITLAPSVTTGSGTLTASDDVFTAGNVGSLFYVIQPRVNVSVSGSATGTGVIGTSLLVEGDFSFNTHGTWAGTVELQRSIDDSTWETYRTWVGNSDRNVQFTATEEDDQAYYRINVTAYTSGTIQADLTVNTSTQQGIARVTAYTNTTQVSITVLKDFASTNADVRWAEGSWSTRRGFPQTVTFFESRCVYAGTDYQPQTVWFSGVDDFEDFCECTKDDSAFSLTLSSGVRNAIQWIEGLEGLMVGTSGGEWLIRSSSFDEPLTPTNFSAKIQTTYGSKSLQALPVNDVILMVDFVGRKVREITYNDSRGKYVAPDLTALAEHVTRTSEDFSDSGIVAHAFQKNPDPIYWACRADGTLISMTYEREQNVIGWARHPFETGPGVTSEIPAVPATNATYKYTWINQNGTVYGLPLGDGELSGSLDVGGAAVNVGGGTVGLPFAGHPFNIGQTLLIAGTTNYNGAFTIQGSTTANRLDITAVYTAETFDGTETVVRTIATELGDGRMVQDSDGNLWVGHNWVAAKNTAITKITPAGALTYDDLSWIPTAPVGSTTVGLSFTDDETYLYGLVIETAVRLWKWDVSTGALAWYVAPAGVVSGIDLAVDSSDNVYIALGNDGIINRFSAVDGTTTELTNMGRRASGTITGGLKYEVEVSGDYVCAGGEMGVITAAGPSVIGQMYNFGVRQLDDSAGATAVLGGTYVSGSLTNTGRINHKGIAIYGGYIYVLTTLPSVELHKLQWDGTSLTILKTVSGPTGGCGIYFDLYGNLVVIVQQSGGGIDEIFHFYDTDLTALSTIDNFNNTILASWQAAIANHALKGGIGFNGALGTNGTAAIPSQTISGLGVNSVATIPSTNEDEVWLIVARQINGVAADTTTRYLEQMQPRWVEDQEQMWFVDAALSLDGADADGIVSGLDHLEGEQVYALVDGAVVAPQTVSSGQVNLGTAVTTQAIVGIPFRYTLQPMRFDLDVNATTKGSLKRFAEAVISFYRTLNAEYGEDVNNLFNIDWRTEEAYGSPPALYTGDKPVVHDGGFSTEDPFVITGNDPLPCTVRAIVPRIEVSGR